VCPVAIKYNKIFVDAFWNSRRQSFSQHLLRLMTSWAAVADVWFLEPQTCRPGGCVCRRSGEQREHACVMCVTRMCVTRMCV
jgi:glycerol-3-phosphate O-acyltransferase 3/4